jgi:hypothetical protein
MWGDRSRPSRAQGFPSAQPVPSVEPLAQPNPAPRHNVDALGDLVVELLRPALVGVPLELPIAVGRGNVDHETPAAGADPFVVGVGVRPRSLGTYGGPSP